MSAILGVLVATELWIAGARLVGDTHATALHIKDGRIAGKAPAPPKGAQVMVANGLLLAPAVLDAHVHLSVPGDLREVARDELKRGVAAVLDLGEPERLLSLLPGLAPLRVRFAGPLLTAPKGYPTQSWGADGYGLELTTEKAAREAVARLAASGARFLKLAFDSRFAQLSPEVAHAACDAAHARGMLVAAHALEVDAVSRALAAGADVLAHAPVEELPAELIDQIGSRKLWVISTLHAFGGLGVANLRALHKAGARIVYGTDLGNTGTAAGIDPHELELLASAGLSAAEIVAAATSGAAELLGYPDLGRLDTGCAASLLALSGDPLRDPTALARPTWVMIEGVRRE